MADRFWVGGAGTWNTSSTTNWSATSGGASGASVPTSADDVYFNSSSGTPGTVTMTGALNCRSITTSVSGWTFANGTSPTLSIFGSLAFTATTTWSMTGFVTFAATTVGNRITTNGTTISGAVFFSGTGGEWTLGSAFTTSSGITHTAGTFRTAGYSVSATTYNTSGSTTRSLILDTSTFTSTSSGSAWVVSSATGMTFLAGTSTISFPQTAIVFTGGGLNYYNVTFASTTATVHRINDVNNSFYNLTITPPNSPGATTFSWNGRQTINGSLTVTGGAGNRRVLISPNNSRNLSATLVNNGSSNIRDVDFQDIIVTGIPLSGTRIGNLGGCSGITFSTAKTVYWNLAGSQNWSATGWAATSGGTPDDSNFPLPQDTAVFNNSGAITTITLDSAITFAGTVDMSARTLAMTVSVSSSRFVYGNWRNGSGTTITGVGSNAITFAGRTTQTITSNGIGFGCYITVNSPNGALHLADALTLSGTNQFALTAGTFDTKGYAFSADRIVSTLPATNPVYRLLTLNNSTLTLSSAATALNLSGLGFNCNAGTSTINCSGNGSTINTSPDSTITLNNLNFTNVTDLTQIILSNAFTVNNLTIAGPATGIVRVSLAGNITVNGTLSCSGTTAVGRVFLFSSSPGVPRTLTVRTFATASDIDFRDITLAGNASGLSGTRLGNCGGNTGITFTAAKTVYWNLAGVNTWGTNGWCTSNDGGATFGSPNVNNFPLAQDTAIINNNSAGTSLNIDTFYNLSTINTLSRTNAFTISSALGVWFYGSLLTGSGVTLSFTDSNGIYTGIRSSATWTSNGTTWQRIWMYNIGGTLTLGDAFTSSGILGQYAGTFDAATYNVTINNYFANDASFTKILNMGSGTWSITGSFFLWQASSGDDLKINKQTANIILTGTTSGIRYFISAPNHSLNKLTIGGSTGSPNTNIYDGYFTELASTKTVAHTITFSGSIYTNAWTITGTAGNVVSITGGTLYLLGAVPTGIDYIAASSLTIAPGSTNFYVGANSTVTSCTGTIAATAVPAARNLFWVGGTGNWSDTAKWSTSSGGAGGAAIPTSLDTVTFNTASNATGYTVTINVDAKVASCNFGNPASGVLTVTGSSALTTLGALTFGTSTSITLSGNINFLGTSSNNITANGISSSSSNWYFYNGTWTLAGAITVNSLYFYGGTFNSGGFSIATVLFNANNYNAKTINLGASTIGSGNTITTADFRGYNTTLNAGTSTIGITGSSTFSGFGYTYFNLTVGAGSGTTTVTCAITGANTFNNLTASGPPTIGTGEITFDNNQTISGTLTCSGNSAVDVRKMFLRSATIGTQVTLTCNAFATPTDCNYRDIRIAGNAVASGNITGTRLGDAGGNSGITFDSPKSVFWIGNLTSWWTASWATTSGGAGSALNFPLPQDTAVFDNNGSPGTLNLTLTTHCGTIDFSRRTSALTLSFANILNLYDDLVMSSAITCTNLSLYCLGRNIVQTITSSGVILGSSSSEIRLLAVGSIIRITDNLNLGSTGQINVFFGTFDASTSNVTALNVNINYSTSVAHGVLMGTGTWSLSGTSTIWATSTSAGDLYTHDPGTSTLILSNDTTTTKTLDSRYISFNRLVLSGSAVCTYSFGNSNSILSCNQLASTRTGAATINLVNYGLSIGSWAISGSANNLITIAGNNSNNPGTISYTGTVALDAIDYLQPQNVYAFTSTVSTLWYVGVNSVNTGGGLGFTYTPNVPATIGTGDLNPSTQIVLSTSTTRVQSYTMPTNWNNLSNTIEGIGPGGNGSGRQSPTLGGMGGGGGSYSKKNNLNLTAGVTTYYFIPAGGTQTDTWFDDLNILTNSSSMVNTTSWTTLNATILSGVTDPFGGKTAIKLQETTTNGSHYIRQLLTVQTGGVSTPVTISWYVKASDNVRFSQEVYDTTGNNGVSATANLSLPNFPFIAGTYGSGFTSASTTLGTDQFATGANGNGWFRHTLRFNTTYTQIFVSMYLVNTQDAVNYAGVDGNGIFISSPQVNYGSNLKAYTASGANGAYSMSAKAGTNAVINAGTGQTGSQGDVSYIGGSGWKTLTNMGGGGGGAAGKIGPGGNANAMEGGSANNGTLAGPAFSANGNAGTEWGTVGSGTGAGGNFFSGSGFTGGLYGGGGSGSATDLSATGGTGGPGLIVLTYIDSSYTTVYLTSGTSWTVPVDWTNVNLIEAVGAGGNGISSVGQTSGAGGGGGAYSRVSNIVLTPNSTVSFQIGRNGGTVGYGTSPTANTWFLNGSTLVAAGGQTPTGNVIAAGGSASNCVGTVMYSGGSGSAATPTVSGAGGGAGGYSGNGYSANVATSGAAGINGFGAVISGVGGKGGAFDFAVGYNGASGLLYGAGGGGGAGVSFAMNYDYDLQGYSGNGTPGIIAITYRVGKNLYIQPGVNIGPGIRIS